MVGGGADEGAGRVASDLGRRRGAEGVPEIEEVAEEILSDSKMEPYHGVDLEEVRQDERAYRQHEHRDQTQLQQPAAQSRIRAALG